MSVLNLLNLSDDDRKASLESVHPKVDEQGGHWQVLLDALDATGGFADGGYLWKFPAELPEDFKERSAQARYHNFVATLVDLYVSYLYAEGVNRSTTNTDLEAWWQDVDGSGTTIDTFLRRAVAMALATSHCGVLVDRTADAATGPSKAEDRARVFAAIYPPTSILDWRVIRGELVGVKLKECAPSDDIATAEDADAFRYLLWDREAFVRFTSEGKRLGVDDPAVAEGEPALGLVPFVTLVPKPSVSDPRVGRSIVGHANVVKALYNRPSEEDHVLRGQAFSLLTAEAPADATAEDITAAQLNIATNYGVKRVVVAKARLDYISPDMAIPERITASVDFLVRELYRAASVPYTEDSREAETAEAIALKHRELNTMLQATAAACASVERAMARFWFAWTAPTEEIAERDYEAADIQITYPRQFFTESLMTDLEAWGTAVTAVHSETFRKHQEKRVVKRTDPDLVQQPELLTKIEAEIDSSEKPPTPAEEAAKLRASAAGRVAGAMPPAKDDEAA